MKPIITFHQKLKVQLELFSFIFHLTQSLSQLLCCKLNFRNIFEKRYFVLEHESKLDQVPILNPILPNQFIIVVDPPTFIAMNYISKVEINESKTRSILLEFLILCLLAGLPGMSELGLSRLSDLFDLTDGLLIEGIVLALQDA